MQEQGLHAISGKKVSDDLLLVTWISHFTLALKLCMCHFGDASLKSK